MAMWRRKPKEKVLIHSDQGSHFTSMDWASLVIESSSHGFKKNLLPPGMCLDQSQSGPGMAW